MKNLQVFLNDTETAFGITNVRGDDEEHYPIAIIANNEGNLNSFAHGAPQPARFFDDSSWQLLGVSAEDLLAALIQIKKRKENEDL